MSTFLERVEQMLTALEFAGKHTYSTEAKLTLDERMELLEFHAHDRRKRQKDFDEKLTASVVEGIRKQGSIKPDDQHRFGEDLDD